MANLKPPKKNLPKLEDLEKYITDYGWKFRKLESAGETCFLAPVGLKNGKGILVVFDIQSEFVMVSTTQLRMKVPPAFAKDLLLFNDTLKLAKLYALPRDDNKELYIELGFELWAESWNKKTFFAFMDMLVLAIERTVQFFETNKIPGDTRYVTFELAKS